MANTQRTTQKKPSASQNRTPKPQPTQQRTGAPTQQSRSSAPRSKSTTPQTRASSLTTPSSQKKQEENLNKLLILAIYKNDLKQVKNLLAQGANPHYINSHGYAPIHYVRDVKIAQALFQAGVNPNQVDKDGNTLLHNTTNTALIRVLLDNGAHINVINNNGKTPFDTTKNKNKKQYLAFNGGISASKKQPHKIKEALQQGKRVIYNPECAPISEKEIHTFCQQNIKCIPNTPTAQKTLVNGLIEALKTPTGRIQFNLLKIFILSEQQKNPNYKLEVEFSPKTNTGYLGCVYGKNPHRIILCHNSIKKLFKDKRAQNFQIGATFLHEFGHVMQFNGLFNKSKISAVSLDAATNAFSNQIAIESPYEENRTYRNISQKDRQAYEEAVNLQPDGSFDIEKAFNYSIQQRQRYINHFNDDHFQTPNDHHGYISRQIGYLLKDIPFILLLPKNNKQNKRHSEYLLNHPVTKALKQPAEIILKNSTNEERSLLVSKILKKQKITRADFKSEEAYNAALQYIKITKDIKSHLQQIAILSPQIHDNPNNQKLIQQSQRHLTYLKKQYNIDLPSFNQNNERIASTHYKLEHSEPSSQNTRSTSKKSNTSTSLRTFAQFEQVTETDNSSSTLCKNPKSMA